MAKKSSTELKPSDCPAEMEKKIRAQDDAFQGAMLNALESGEERLPPKAKKDGNRDFMPKHFDREVVGGTSSSAGWDFEPTRIHEGS